MIYIADPEMTRHERRALLWSLVGHLALMAVFTIQLPIKSVAHKPVLLFLGSILDTNELTAPDDRHYPAQSINLPIRISPGTITSTKSELSKPGYSQSLPITERTYQKNSFLPDNQPSVDDNALELQKLGIQLEAPPRPSLQMTPYKLPSAPATPRRLK